MYYGTIKTMDTANGPGLRVSLFVSGCHHACPGCFNAEARNFHFGKPFTQETIDELLKELKADHISGLTLLGGEPFAPENQHEVWKLVQQVRTHCPGKTIWAYSGFTYEFMQEVMVPHLPFTGRLLENLDVLIDGRFEQDLLDLNLKFRGSRNQRVIDLPATLKKEEVIWSSEIDDQNKRVFRQSPEREKFTEMIKNYGRNKS